MYSSLAAGSVDVISAYSTDGRLKALGLRSLEDAADTFPPYDAAMVVCTRTLERYPELRDLFDELAGRIDEQEMQTLNSRIDQDKLAPKVVARQWLRSEGLIE